MPRMLLTLPPCPSAPPNPANCPANCSIVYDTTAALGGALGVKAIRLSDSFVEAYREGERGLTGAASHDACAVACVPGLAAGRPPAARLRLLHGPGSLDHRAQPSSHTPIPQAP